MIDTLDSLVVVFISQYVHVCAYLCLTQIKHHTVYLESLNMQSFCLSIIPQWSCKRSSNIRNKMLKMLTGAAYTTHTINYMMSLGGLLLRKSSIVERKWRHHRQWTVSKANKGTTAQDTKTHKCRHGGSYGLRACVAEAEGLPLVQGRLRLHTEFQACKDYITGSHLLKSNSNK